MSEFQSHLVAQRANQANGVLLVLFLVLCGAFYKAQILGHTKYKDESEKDSSRELPISTPRGLIVDRNGTAIAENIPGYSIKLFANDSFALRSVVEQMQGLIPLDPIDPDAVIRRWKSKPYLPVVVFASGSDSTVAVLEEHRAALPGLVIQNEPKRMYLAGPAVAHLVGFLGQPSEADIDERHLDPGELVGKDGLEGQYDSVLRGQRGARYVEVTSLGFVVKNQIAKGILAPVQGASMKTTIDLPLQIYIDSLWRASFPTKNGAVVAMTPDGQILAYLSFPSFDPNAFIGPKDHDAVAEALNGAERPMFDRVIAAKFPPASPWKLATAIMALKRGLVTMDSHMSQPCTLGGYRFGNRSFGCWANAEGKAHGSLTLAEAIATSCDVYFYQLGQLVGRDAMFEDAPKMGMASRSGVDIDGEKASSFPNIKNYIDSRGKSTWFNGEVLNLAIGQGQNQQTLMNMTAFYAALAGDGIKRAPYLYRKKPDAPEYDLGLTTEQLNDFRAALAAVVSHGTAGASGGSAIKVAGKTGTGQTTGKEATAWFIGFAPYDNPRIVIGMVVEEGIHGSIVAPYVVKMISRYLGESVSSDLPQTEVVVDTNTSKVRPKAGAGGRPQ